MICQSFIALFQLLSCIWADLINVYAIIYIYIMRTYRDVLPNAQQALYMNHNPLLCIILELSVVTRP